MKSKIQYIIAFISLAMLAVSCGEREPQLLESSEFLYFETDSSIVIKGSTNAVSVNALFSSTNGATVTATAVVEVAAQNAVLGTDFDLSPSTLELLNGDGDLVLEFNAENQFTQKITILPKFEALDTEGDGIVTLRVKSLTSGEAGFPGPDRNNSQHVMTLAEINCEYEIEGTYTVTTTQTNPAGCSGVTNTVQVAIIGEGLFTITDLTGGLYKNCYGAFDNPGRIVGQCNGGNGLQIIDQPDVVYGGDVFNGTGLINDDGSFTISWRNNYGDRGTSVHVPASSN